MKDTLDTVTCIFSIAEAVDTCGNYFINPLECFYFQEVNCTKLITTTPAPVTTPAPSKLLLRTLKFLQHLRLDKWDGRKPDITLHLACFSNFLPLHVGKRSTCR